MRHLISPPRIFVFLMFAFLSRLCLAEIGVGGVTSGNTAGGGIAVGADGSIAMGGVVSGDTIVGGVAVSRNGTVVVGPIVTRGSVVRGAIVTSGDSDYSRHYSEGSRSYSRYPETYRDYGRWSESYRDYHRASESSREYGRYSSHREYGRSSEGLPRPRADCPLCVADAKKAKEISPAPAVTPVAATPPPPVSTAPPPPAPPAKNNFAALSFSPATGRHGMAWDFPDIAAAEEAANRDCREKDCRVIAEAKNGCAAAYSENLAPYNYRANYGGSRRDVEDRAYRSCVRDFNHCSKVESVCTTGAPSDATSISGSN